ncbi:hypothetical protein SmJEL517_g00493 [Synchytrium microbalum]|uniref:Mitogen-activated protein kinase n=1 Tax=Synchytrium microbalum TaxID=1806994 RepID=A0A507CDA9_9FUNG|nr:uncharacterized protein SmJEL517_g00493 [Synchytrium microbalum]TPX37602.1 hypothetical protein SmJEL517_g00493 [Synchytrium microbalum]
MSSMIAPILLPNTLPTSLDRRFKLIRELGQGAYGTVVAAKNIETSQEVAIKKVTKIFEKPILAKRALRELKLLIHFNGHENITSVFDVDLVDPRDFNEIFIVQELMEADLHQIIRSEQPLTDAHFQYFLYQICRGLKYIHSANVLHRDLKPGNLLVNADCELKICDFGLARGFSDTPVNNAGFLTEYVATRWYRAPEIMLSFRSYTKAIDMWSVGCIFAELLGGKPLFKGRDYVDQLNQILSVLGTPDDATIERIGSARAQVYIRSLPKMTKTSFTTLFPTASPLAIDLLESLLSFDPARRMTVEEALSHKYLENYHDENDEPLCSEMFDFGFEQLESMDDMRTAIAQEIYTFKQSQAARRLQAAQKDYPTPLNRNQVDSVPREWAELQQADEMMGMDLDQELSQKQWT